MQNTTENLFEMINDLLIYCCFSVSYFVTFIKKKTIIKQLFIICSGFMNLNNTKNIVALIFLVFLLNGCTTVIFMNRSVPPQLVLEKQPARIIFNNYFDYQANPEIKDKHEAAYALAIEEFAQTLVDITPPEETKAVFLYDTTGNYQNKELLFDTLWLKNEIISLCKKNSADFLLSLDSLNFYFDWEVIREEDSDGSVSKTKEFYLFCNYYLTLYNRKGVIKQRNSLSKSCLYSSRPTFGALITIKPSLSSKKNKIQKMAKEVGMEYIGLFYPSFENYKLELYIGNVFRESNTLIKSGQYNEAIVLLLDLTNTLEPKQAAKAQHNLDVTKELKNNNINISMED